MADSYIVVLQGLDGGIQCQLSLSMLAFVGCQFNFGPLIYQLIACCIIPQLKNCRENEYKIWLQ